MTTADLHTILDDENRKLSLDELKQVIYKMKQDAFNEYAKLLDTFSANWYDPKYIDKYAFYKGEQNAFQIVLDLLEHCDHLIKLPYLLCTSRKFACVIWRDKDGKVNKTYIMPIEEAKRFLAEKESDNNE